MSKHLLALATSIAALAGIWTWFALSVPTLAGIPFVLWPTFVAWAAFFYAGATTEGMLKGIVQMLSGVVLSWIMMTIFVAANLPPAWVPIILGVVVLVIAWTLTVLTGLHKWWTQVPAGFCGAAAYFGVASAIPAVQAHSLTHLFATLFPLLSGELLGWLSASLVALALPARAAVAEAGVA